MNDRLGVLLGWPRGCPSCEDTNFYIDLPAKLKASEINRYLFYFKCYTCGYNWVDVCYYDDNHISLYLVGLKNERPFIIPIETNPDLEDDQKTAEARRGIEVLLQDKFKDPNYSILFIIPLRELVSDLPPLEVELGQSKQIKPKLILP